MPTTYIQRSDTSDLSGGGEYSRKLLAGTAAVSDLVIALAASETKTGHSFTEAGIPGADGVTGDYTVEVDIAVGDSNVMISVAVGRVNSAGTLQTESSFTAEQVAAGAVLTFNLTSVDLGTWAAGDRLRVAVRYRNSHTHTARNVTVSFNTNESEVIAPWSSGTNFDETGRAVTVTSTVVATDTAAFLDATVSTPGYLDAGADTSSDGISSDATKWSTGNLEAIVCVRYPDWLKAAFALVSIIGSASGSPGPAWALERQTDGGPTNTTLRFRWWDTTDTERTLNAGTGALGDPGANNHKWLRVLWNPTAETCDFYHSSDPISTDPASVSWTHLVQQTIPSGANTIRAGGSFNSGRIGGNTGTGAPPDEGEFFAAYVWYNGTREWSADFRDADQGWDTHPTPQAQDDDANTYGNFEGSASWVAGVAAGGPGVIITSTVTATDSLGGGTNFDETGRSVAVVATVTATDTASFTESLTTTGVSVVAASDTAAFSETLTVSATSTVVATDGLGVTETLAVAITATVNASDDIRWVEAGSLVITSTVAGTDTQAATEAPQAAVSATVAATDTAAFAETLAVSITSTITATDSETPLEAVGIAIASTVTAIDDQHYDELVLPVGVIATVTASDTTGDAENLAITVTATVEGTDALSTTEPLAVAITSTVSSADTAGFVEASEVSIAATVTASDSLASGNAFDETGRFVLVSSSLTSFDIGAFQNPVAIVGNILVSANDLLIAAPLIQPAGPTKVGVANFGHTDAATSVIQHGTVNSGGGRTTVGQVVSPTKVKE